MPKSNSARYAHVAALLFNEPWLLTEDMHARMVQIFARRAGGERWSKAEISLAISGRSSGDGNKPAKVGSISVIPVVGVMSQRASAFTDISGGTSTDRISAWLREAMNDAEVETILFRLDSPGGSSFGVAELADEIRAAREKKRVVAIADPMAASGAYWLASATSQINVSPSGMLGSIGVYIPHTEYSEQLRMAGIRTTYIHAGKHKVDGNGAEPLSPQARDSIQSRVNAIYDQFITAVAQGRGTTPEKVKEGYGQGQTLLAPQAVAANLADRVITFDALMAELQANASPPKSSGTGSSKSARAEAPALEAGAPQVTDPQVAAITLGVDVAAAGITSQPAEHPAMSTTPATSTTPAAQTTTTTPAADPVAAAVAAERERNSQIRATALTLVRANSLPADIAEKMVDAAITGGHSLDQFNRAAIGELGKYNQAHSPANDIRGGTAELDKFGEAATHSLMLRAFGENGLGDEKVAAGAQDLRGLRVADLAMESLKRTGVRVQGMSHQRAVQIALGAPTMFDSSGFISAGIPINTTGTFSSILLQAFQKRLYQRQKEAQATFRRWCKRGPNQTDFRAGFTIKGSEASDLQLVGEGDEPKGASRTDDREAIAVDRFSSFENYTYQMALADDLGWLNQWPSDMAAADERTQNKLAYSMLTSNPSMRDGVAVFHTDRGNIVDPGGAPSVEEIGKIRAKLRVMRGMNADVTLNSRLAIMLFPVALETVGETLFASTADPASSNAGKANIFKDRFELVFDAQLDLASTVQYYGLIDQSEGTLLEYRYLEGMENAQITSTYDEKKWVRRFQIDRVFGFGFVDAKAAIRSKGTA